MDLLLHTSNRLMAIVLAGGQGRRLRPLTTDRAKPAVPFGGTLRLIDFVLSNLANARFTDIVVLTEYQHRGLDHHVARLWGDVATTVASVPEPAVTSRRPSHLRGTAGAVHTILPLIEAVLPDIVCVFGADHVYRMDPAQMVSDHVKGGSRATVSVVRMRRDRASAFGVVDPGPNASVAGFAEKSENPPADPDDVSMCLASMGNYVFDREVLVEALERDAADVRSHHDFGGDVLPDLANRGWLRYYDFGRNRVPGQPANEVGYWRDVGTIDAYHAAHMDLIAREPAFSLHIDSWPTRPCRTARPHATVVDVSGPRTGLSMESLVCPGAVLDGGRAVRSVIGPRCLLDDRAHVEEAVLLDGARIGAGAVIRRAVIDSDVIIPAGERIGVDAEADRARFTVSDDGVIVVPRGYRFGAEPSPTERAVPRSVGHGNS